MRRVVNGLSAKDTQVPRIGNNRKCGIVLQTLSNKNQVLKSRVQVIRQITFMVESLLI